MSFRGILVLSFTFLVLALPDEGSGAAGSIGSEKGEPRIEETQ
jgi:hypothetical protein